MRLSSNPGLRFARCGALVLVAGVAAFAQAQDQPAATLETERNVYTAGGHVRPTGPVQGDYMAAGGRIVIDQRIGSDAMLVGGSVDVRAPIGDDLRVSGGDVSMESTVGGELFAAGGNVVLTRNAVIARSARIYGSNVNVDGRIEGGLHGGGEKFTINGEVRGNVDVAAQQVELGPSAKIGGALQVGRRAVAQRAEGATIAGAITHDADGSKMGRRGEWGSWHMRERRGGGVVGGLLSYLGLLACGAFLLLVAPRFSAQAPERIRNTPWVSLGIGFATVFATPALAVLLFVTLLGIPLGLIVLALYPVVMLAGFIVGTLFLARLIPGTLRQEAPANFGRAVGYFAIALLIVLLLARVPFAGGLALAFVTFAGIGACAVEVYARRKGAPPPPPAAATALP
jgi:hypothetical protein